MTSWLQLRPLALQEFLEITELGTVKWGNFGNQGLYFFKRSYFQIAIFFLVIFGVILLRNN